MLCRYAERGGFILNAIARKGGGIYDPVFGKEFPSDVGICCTECRGGTLISRNGNHALTSSFSVARPRSFIRWPANLAWTFMLSAFHLRGSYSAPSHHLTG